MVSRRYLVLKTDRPDQAGAKELARASAGRERVTTGLVRHATQQAGFPLHDSRALVRRLLVAHQPIGPAVGDFDLELIDPDADDTCDIDSSRSTPDDPQVFSV